VNTHSPHLPLAPSEKDDLGRRSRLISLVYEVLRDMKTPTEEATNIAMFSDLGRAFSDKATALANLEATTTTIRGAKLPKSMFSSHR
jgi:hypothetical protein